MPTWSHELPNKQKHMGFDLRRTPPAGALQAIITCDDLLVVDTHFWHGRTTPCERQQLDSAGQLTAGNCAACNDAVPYRTHVYVSAFAAKLRQHFIFECTAHAAKPLAEYRAAALTLRGCVIHASRPLGAKTSKVAIQTNAANLSLVTLPDPPDLIKALSVIWRLPATGVATHQPKRQPPTVATKKEPLDRMRNQLDNLPDPLTVGEVLAGNGKPRQTASAK